MNGALFCIVQLGFTFVCMINFIFNIIYVKHFMYTHHELSNKIYFHLLIYLLQRGYSLPAVGVCVLVSLMSKI